MNLACRSLAGQSSDSNSIAFNIAVRNVEITAKGTSERLDAVVQREGRVSIPCTVLHGLIKTLPYFGGKTIEIGFSAGKMSVDSMVFHNQMIVLNDPVFPEGLQSFRKRGRFSAQES